MAAPEGVITSAAELTPGARVVYPNQGVCAVVGVEVQSIAGQQLEVVRMRREEDGATVLVPRGKVPSVGLRRVASRDLIEGVFHLLAAPFEGPELDWKARHRDNADRMVAGGVLGVAEVVRELNALSVIRPLPTKEREIFDNARHLLTSEVAVSLGVPPGTAEDYVDLALMPPAGTTFKLRPPPRPVLMPDRPRRRRFVADEAEEAIPGLDLEDLGLAELGEGEAAEAGAEGAEAAEGGEQGAEVAPAAEEAPPAEPPRKPARGPRAAAPGKGGARKAPAPAKKKEKEKAPPRKAPARAAPKKPASKAAKRGGKR